VTAGRGVYGPMGRPQICEHYSPSFVLVCNFKNLKGEVDGMGRPYLGRSSYVWQNVTDGGRGSKKVRMSI
jgi:hypothetical protein